MYVASIVLGEEVVCFRVCRGALYMYFTILKNLPLVTGVQELYKIRCYGVMVLLFRFAKSVQRLHACDDNEAV